MYYEKDDADESNMKKSLSTGCMEVPQFENIQRYSTNPAQILMIKVDLICIAQS